MCVCSCESCGSNPHQTVCVCLPSGGSSSPACTHRPQARPQLQISTHPESSTVQQAPPSYWYFGTGSITVPCPRPASPYASIAYFLLLYVVLVQDPGVFCHLPFIWCKNMRLKRGSLTLSLRKTICAEGKSCFARAIHLCLFLCKTHVTHVLTSDSRRAGCQWSQAQRVTCAAPSLQCLDSATCLLSQSGATGAFQPAVQTGVSGQMDRRSAIMQIEQMLDLTLFLASSWLCVSGGGVP